MPDQPGLRWPMTWWTAAAARLRSANPFLVDLAVAGMVVLAYLAPFIWPRFDEDVPNASWDSWSPWGYVLVLSFALPLMWRRRFPFGCLVATIVLLQLYELPEPSPTQPIGWGILVAIYTLAERARVWQRVAMLGLILCAIPFTVRSPTTFTIGLLTGTGAYILGRLAATRRAYIQALEERAGQLEREREAEAARAGAEERARIARDMHDVLAHAVSLMVVQAEAGPVVVRSNPERAERAFDAIADAGRDAMVQLRRMLGVLKEEQDVGVRAPQPSVAGISDLVAQVGRTGLRVDLQTSGEPRPLPVDVEVAAYRIVQEALTNTVKHAAAGLATVRLDWKDADLVITVTDDGRGPAGGRSEGRAGGHGLIGIRERAAACGGAAEAGHALGGGFQVTARLPYAEMAAR